MDAAYERKLEEVLQAMWDLEQLENEQAAAFSTAEDIELTPEDLVLDALRRKVGALMKQLVALHAQ